MIAFFNFFLSKTTQGQNNIQTYPKTGLTKDRASSVSLSFGSGQTNI